MNDNRLHKEAFLNIRWHYIIFFILVISILTVYGRVHKFEFINFDDDVYVTKNRHVQSGLTPNSLTWAFSLGGDKDSTYWHPLTWLSHMLDVELYGMNPESHHMTNLIFHILNSLLLFWVFQYMTGNVWRSGFVAILFALHPLNVESVAWVAERKNVLSTFLGLLTIWAYIRYVEGSDLLRYFLALILYSLGLMAKPMLVTLPFLLLLLDYWPLRRIQIGRQEKSGTGSIFRIFGEKIPFLVISAITVFISSRSLQTQKLIISTDLVPMGLRLANALVSYIKYILKLIWPHNLSVYYPFPERVPFWQVISALILLTALTIVIIRELKRRPYLGVGWLWYLGTLIPVSGLVQTGLWPEMADRWAYVPHIGLFIIIAWGIPELTNKLQLNRKRLIAIGLVILMTLMAKVTGSQVKYWQNSITLFERADKVVPNNYIINSNLGNALARKGRLDDAMIHYSKALKINPANAADVHNNLGAAYLVNNRIKEAIIQFHLALQIDSGHVDALKNINRLSAVYEKRVDDDSTSSHRH